MDQEEIAWDLVRDRINIDVESGEFAALEKESDEAFGCKAADDDRVLILDLDDQQAGPSEQKNSRKGPGRRPANPTLDNLLGQANLEHARGRTKEAMEILFEVVKLAPYHVQTYKELSDLYSEVGQKEKSFEFKMLAALLNTKTTAEEWEEIAESAKLFNRLELAVACLAKAIRCDPENWVYYEKRIQILDSTGETDLAMKTRLQAAQSINCQTSQVNFVWIDKLIKTAADYYCTLKDEERATEALETFILRSRQFGRPIDFEHLALLGMWIGKGRFEDSAKSILAMHNELIQAVDSDGISAMTVHFTNTDYQLSPFPPASGTHWIISEGLNTMLLSYLTICWIHLGRLDLVPQLIDCLLERPVGSSDEENAFLDIARSFHSTQQLSLATEYMQKLRKARPEFNESTDAWFLIGCLHQTLGQVEHARTAYETVISFQPGHIDARINLSTILQQLDQSELALETLKDLDFDSCSHIPDERLLCRQAEVLLQQRKMDQYISCLRLLLIPHFHQIHRSDDVFSFSRRRNEKIFHSSLKKYALDAIKGGSLERMVKRLGQIAHSAHRQLGDLSPNEFHDFAFKLSEALYFAGEFEEMLHVVCYAFLHPKITNLGMHIFNNLLFFASLKANHHQLAFEFLRFHMTFTLPKLATASKGKDHGDRPRHLERVYSAMNYIFCQHQSVNYHRFIMRQLVKQSDSQTLHIISGNNSLITGAYRHALGEYFSVYLRDKSNPLVAFLIALTFTHISCKKDISSRHMVALRALAFMKIYAGLRSSVPTQEIQYNLGRMFHQMGLFANALKCYERVLYECPVPLVWGEDPDTGALRAERSNKYGLQRQAAYNLSLIYDSNGNHLMARHILEQFCTI
uniref:General transcription factor 3C polypeptide 3 n=1 Tax=Globodera rostochiensis TaxID=31243 RepID=A0A914GTP2_GLORO